MAKEASAAAEPVTTEEPSKLWQPSRPAEHRVDRPAAEPTGLIVERPEGGGVLGAVSRFLKRQFVRLVIGLGIFILAAIVYDNTLNRGTWTIREQKQKPAEHKGAEPIQATPDG